MTDASYSADPPAADDPPPDGVDLNRTPLAGDPFSSGASTAAYDPSALRVDLYGNPVARNPYFPDPNDPTLDIGQVLHHLASGAKPEDFHPAVQPLAEGLSIAFEPQPPMGPGLLGSLDDIKAAAAAQPAETSDGEVVPATPAAPPMNLDTTVPDLNIRSPSPPNGPQGLQDVTGLPLDPGHGAVPRFDGLIAHKVSSVFDDLNDQGIPVRLRDGFRTRAMQVQAQKKYHGAAPGDGLHEAGLAFDVNWEDLNPAQQQAVIQTARQHGFEWGGSFSNLPDPRHFFVDPFDSLADRQAYIRQLQQSQGR